MEGFEFLVLYLSHLSCIRGNLHNKNDKKILSKSNWDTTRNIENTNYKQHEEKTEDSKILDDSVSF